MPKMEVFAAVAFAFALAYLWMRWDEHQMLRKKKIEQRPFGEAGGPKHR